MAFVLFTTTGAPVPVFAQDSVSLKVQGVLERNPEFQMADFDLLPGTSIVVEGTTAGTTRKYSVRRGETISQIAQREMGNPVFMPGGSFDRLLKLNPQLKHRGGMNYAKTNGGEGSALPSEPLAAQEPPPANEPEAPAVAAKEPEAPVVTVKKAEAPVAQAPAPEPTPGKTYSIISLSPGRITQLHTPAPAPRIVPVSERTSDAPKAVAVVPVNERVSSPNGLLPAIPVSERTALTTDVALAPATTTPVDEQQLLDPNCHRVQSRSRNIAFGSSGPGAPPIIAFRPYGKHGYEYTIQPGDTLKKIAHYWFSSKEFADLKGEKTLREWNPSLRKDREPRAGSLLLLQVMNWNAREIVVCDTPDGEKFVKEEVEPEPTRAPATSEAMNTVTVTETPQPPRPAPSPTPKEYVEVGKFGVGLKTSSWSVKAEDRGTGGHAVANSNLNFGIEPRFVQAGDNGITSTYFVDLTRNSVIQPRTRQFADGTFMTYGFGVEVAIPASSNEEWIVGLKRAQEFFFESITSTTLALSNVPIVEFSGAYRRVLYTAQKGNGAVIVGGSALLPGASDTFDVKWGWIYRVGYESLLRLHAYDVVGALFYEGKTQNTSLVKQSSQEVWLGLGIRWRLYDEK